MSALEVKPKRLRWNHPRINIFRVNVCFLSFINCGFINGSFGPLIPLLETYYDLNYTGVSFIFLTLVPGYLLSAFITDYLVTAGGRRLIAILSAGLRLISSVVIAFHPPFAAVMCVMLLSGLGTAMCDSTWNVYIGTMEHAHQLLGILHGVFGFSCALSQVYASIVLSKQGKPWYYYYYLQLSAHALELVLATVAFWGDGPVNKPLSSISTTLATPREQLDEDTSIDMEKKAHSERGMAVTSPAEQAQAPQQIQADGSKSISTEGQPIASNDKSQLKQKIIHALHLLKRAALQQPAARTTWLVLLYFGLEWGNEIALSGWNVSFMIHARHASYTNSTFSNMGFWIAFGLGRVCLGFVTAWLGEVLAVTGYLMIVIVSQLIYWLVNDFYVSAVAVAIDGFFLGPVFPAAVFIMGEVLPEELHVVAMSFSMALGLAVGEILPFIAGAIAQHTGINNVMPLVFAMVVATLSTWLALTKPKWQKSWKKRKGEGMDIELDTVAEEKIEEQIYLPKETQKDEYRTQEYRQ